jgi:anti-sigma B factor antagonist
MSAMEMNTRRFEDILVAQPLAKRIDSATASDFKGTIVDFINDGNQKIVLDLVHVDFIDSTGLGMLVSILKSLGRQGILLLCRPSSNVSSLFSITRMHKLFDIFPSVEEAIGAAQSMSSDDNRQAR